MEIKDFLHLYLGCEVLYNDGVYYLESVQHYSLKYGQRRGCFIMIDADDCHWVRPKDIKPILRPLSSMTEEEMNECWFNMEGAVEIRCEYKDGGVKKFDATPAQVVYLLSKGFDLFGLIDAGLAIDRLTTLKH